MTVYEVESVDMLNRIIQTCEDVNKILVIKAEAAWCGPCKAVKPRYQKMAETYSNAVFVTFDVESATDIAEELEISAMPTFIVVKNKKILRRIEGADLLSIQELLDE